MSSLYHLMHRAVDYAGLFPPAGLPMSQVVNNYAKYIHCKEASMLGRLIVPAVKLEAFEDAAAEFLNNDKENNSWRISALVPPIEHSNGTIESGKFDAAFETIEAFNQKHASDGSPSTIVDAVEIKTPTIEVLTATIERLNESNRTKNIEAFLEIPHQTDPTELVELIAKESTNNLCAKIRTGGMTENLIPPPIEIARFIHACASNGVRFKATAGLPHPIRAQHNLTYQADSPSATMHGYLNVFVAAAFAYEHRLEMDQLESIIASQSVDDFEFQEDQIVWSGKSVSNQSITETRTNGLRSFGSCSFAEPTEELTQLPNVSKKLAFEIAAN